MHVVSGPGLPMIRSADDTPDVIAEADAGPACRPHLFVVTALTRARIAARMGSDRAGHAATTEANSEGRPGP